MKLDDLAAYGANVEEGMSRCMNNEDFYLQLVGTIQTEEKFGVLENAIAERRLHDAFDAAHALKGTVANLSLTPLYEPLHEITEALRVETDMDYSSLLARIKEEHARLCSL